MVVRDLEFRVFANPAELAESLAGYLGNLLWQGIQRRGVAGLVVSGGSTPKLLFSRLAEQPLEWSRVFITLADERWVEITAPESNERLVRATLLRKKAARARFIGLKNKASSAGEGEKICEQHLAVLSRPFDAVVLGMGNDGHTASLFPGASFLHQALDPHSKRLCLAVAPQGNSHERMTLTLPFLLDTKKIILHITGQKKKEVLENALAGESITEMPIRAFLGQAATPIIVYWAP
jgi:6-phosphogluconolactonase